VLEHTGLRRNHPAAKTERRVSRILIVDDDPSFLLTLKEAIEARGYDVLAVASGSTALATLDGIDVVVTDYAMPEMDGCMLLERLLAIDSTLPVIMVTAHGSESLAVRALKQGAYDYMSKPFNTEELFYSIERAVETRHLRLEQRARTLEHTIGVRIVGRSLALIRTIETATRVATKDITTLISGETGTGKELVAALLHARSARASKPLVIFNCAAIAPGLAEAELFGYVKGAFTGAVGTHLGYFMQAHGGTLFLDEVGELQLDVQAKLLRVLQEREVQPLGATKAEKVDVRVIAATHRDLAEEVKAGRFREDLYYRLNVIELVVPPLRERTGDVPLLAREFARKYSERFGLGYVVQLAPELVAELERAPWPGNVRQLENTIARCVALSTQKIVGLEALQFCNPSNPEIPDSAQTTGGLSLREQVEAFERNVIRNARAMSGGNQSETARRLQLNRASLYDKLKKYGMTRG
jgi:DNA-binding NtrC family response regulator